MNKQHITLRDDDRATLERLLSAGTLSARKFKRATALLELDRGKTLHDVAATLQTHYTTVAAWRDGYTASGLRCLDDAPRAGRPVEIDGTQRAKITALACSDAPKGHARWSLRLLAEKAVEGHLCEHVSYTVVRDILKKTSESRIAVRLGALARLPLPFWRGWNRYWHSTHSRMIQPTQ